jgi:hypothetical protein
MSNLEAFNIAIGQTNHNLILGVDINSVNICFKFKFFFLCKYFFILFCSFLPHDNGAIITAGDQNISIDGIIEAFDISLK